jgi:hypothetical protein
LVILNFSGLERLDLLLRLAKEDPPEEGWDSSLTSPRNLRKNNPNSPFHESDSSSMTSSSPLENCSQEEHLKDILVRIRLNSAVFFQIRFRMK